MKSQSPLVGLSLLRAAILERSSDLLRILVTAVQIFQGVMSLKDNDLDMKMRRSKCNRFNTQLDHES